MTTYQSIEEGLPRNHPNGSGSDDDKIGLLSNVKRRRQFLNFFKIAIGVVCIEIENDFEWADPNLIIAKTGAVASEEGGNAVDAAITTHICVGTVNVFAADFREVAPRAAHQDMFKKDHLKAKGSIARSTVDTIQSRGGIITMEDLAAYRPTIREPLIGYYQGRKIITSPEPGSGTILLFLLNVLEEYKFHETGRTSLNAQRMAEAFKYAIARRTELGDPAFFKNITAHKERINEIISKEYAARIRANISDTHTYVPNHYDPEYATLEDHGTTHISVVDADEMAVSMTATVFMDPNTGVLFNDQMDDFAIPIPPTIERFWPAPHNFPAPGKKPMSSTSPTIIERPDGRFEMSVGASGGTRIMSAVTQTLLNIYEFNMNVLEAIDYPRLYHPLLPNEVNNNKLS
ncbi:12138_t:CDS:10 [Racocetra fulgida]|uniref:12138_t:CDS:1 n=1 Tax=Racocetra fulgida TaxID=60492 RepID=A0A9N8W9Y5_9GLOM|nr:12138_t:CDS:10 [Racocetra fulgida]